MNYKTTLFLLVLLIAVGVYFFFIDTAEIDDSPIDGSGIKPTLLAADTFDASAVNAITIERGGETIELIKDGDEWNQTKPVQFAINSWSAEQIADDAAKLEVTPAPGSKDLPSAADAGLAPALATVTFKGGDSATVIKLGRTLSIGGRGYAMLGDSDKVYIVTDKLHKLAIDAKPGEWRKKALTGPKESEANHIALARDGQTIELAKTDGRWAFASPNTGRASSSAISDLLNARARLYINEFVTDLPESLAIYGLSVPSLKLAILQPPTEADGEPRTTTIAVGSATDLEKKHYYATIDGGKVVFKIAADDVKKFEKSVNDLREKRITPLASADVTHITVTPAGQSPVKYQRTPEGWGFSEGGPTYDADDTLVGDMLASVTGAEAASYIAGYKGEGDADLTITLAASARPEPETLRFWIQDKTNYVALRGSESIGYVVSMDTITDALAAGQPLAMRSRTIDTLKRDELTNVILKRGNATITFTRESADAEWKVQNVERFETGALTKLIEAATPLKADGWSSDEGAVKSDDTLTLNAGDKSVTITLAEDGRASASDVPGVFIASQALRDAFAAEYAYRTLFDFDASRIKQISTGAVTLSKNDDGKYVAEGDAAIDQTKAGKLYDTLAGLRVERFGATVGAAKHTIIITLNDDTTHALQIDADGNGKLAGQTFILAGSDVEALTATLIADQDAGK